MTFFESVETCLSKFVNFTGRATRSEYWWFYLACMIVSYAVGFLDGLMDGSGVMSTIVALVLCIPIIAAGIRRMHDTGHCGWFILIPPSIIWCFFALRERNMLISMVRCPPSRA